MKNILTALTIATILAIAPSAFAKKTKPPKLLCLAYEHNDIAHQLAFKATGFIRDYGRSVKTYTVIGHDEFGPVSGSAYVVPNTTWLHVTYNTMNWEESYTNSYYELEFNLDTNSGTIQTRRDIWPSGNELIQDDIVSIDCDVLSFPSVGGTEPVKVKVPKLLCLKNPDHLRQQLTLKALGTLHAPEGKVTSYGITGRTLFAIVSGTAYVVPNTNTLHATYKGMHGESNPSIESWELSFDLSTGSGEITKRRDYATGSERSYMPWEVFLADCSSSAPPSSPSMAIE